MKDFIKNLLPTTKIRSITRITLDNELKNQFSRLKKGLVLDVGSKDSPYKNQIPFSKYLRLDLEKESNPDICADLHDVDWDANYFDTIIATEVLEHLYAPQKAVDEIHRLLKPGGICIASTRFIFPYHGGPHDYYRFTWDSLNYIFSNFSEVEVIAHGNRFQAIWQLMNYGKEKYILNIFSPLIAKINVENTKYPLGFVVYAKK